MSKEEIKEKFEEKFTAIINQLMCPMCSKTPGILWEQIDYDNKLIDNVCNKMIKAIYTDKEPSFGGAKLNRIVKLAQLGLKVQNENKTAG